MIKKYLFLIGILLLLASCGGSKKISHNSSEERRNNASEISKNDVFDEKNDSSLFAVTDAAKAFLGTRYKYGGTSKSGMDCSGLIYTAFLQGNIPLPRTSRAMSLEGERIDLEEAMVGDLLFFETNKNKKVINHVGLVVESRQNEINFIHSTTSRGVIISNLNENYWRQHFVMARRVN
ncbi:MAG TPA: C40 family peptidase [Salinimicrobium sp.]|nr:C40 family peptidase [Salinimicrobium sp.]